MAFCTSCGAPMEPASRFCTACGKAVPGAPAATTPAAPTAVSAAAPQRAVAPAPSSGGNALKIVLIVFAVLIGLGILGTIGAIVAARHFAHKIRVDASQNSARVETPFGTVTADDPSAIARNLGVDVYPGARTPKCCAAVNMMGLHVTAARFESDDAPDKVLEFYKARFPKSEIRVTSDAERSLVLSGSNGVIVVKIHDRGGRSLIEISRVGNPGAGDSGSN